MSKVIKIELKILEQIYRNHRLAYAKGIVPKLFGRSEVYRKVAEALGGDLVIEATKQ